jgi:hypothetical protein
VAKAIFVPAEEGRGVAAPFAVGAAVVPAAVFAAAVALAVAVAGAGAGAGAEGEACGPENTVATSGSRGGPRLANWRPATTRYCGVP